MDELHEQTVNLLSFQQMPKNVYDTQVAFNMVARYGEQAVPALATIEQRILRHYQKIAGNMAPLPSVMLVQAPIFHGHAFAVYLEMGGAADIETVSKALSGDHVSITLRAEDAPSNVNAAGQNEILVSIVPDANHENGLWLWVASDNLRITATTAVECAKPWSQPVPGARFNDANCHRPDRASLPAWHRLRISRGRHGTTLPAEVKTIAIPAFVNQTQTYKIEQLLTAAVVSELVTRTHYHVLNEANDAADATLRGTVLSSYTSPLTYDSQTGRAASILVIVSMKVVLTDKQGKTLYENPSYIFREQYQVSRDLTSFFEEDSPAVATALA